MDRTRTLALLPSLALGLLGLTILLPTPVRAQDEDEQPTPQTPEELEQEKQLEFTAMFRAGLEALTRRDLAAGEKLFQRCLMLRKNDSTSYYNLACTYSLMGKPEQAVSALRSAFNNGFRDLAHMERDGDLDPLRKTPEYRAVRGELETLAAQNVPEPLVRLPEGQQGFPLVVWLHADRGRPQEAFERLTGSLSPEWGVLVPAAPIDMRSGRVWDDRAEWLVSEATRKLLQEHPGVDRQRVIVAGEGLSAYRALNLLAHHPDLFSGAVGAGPYLSAGVDEELKVKGRAYLVVNRDDPGEVEAGVEARDRLAEGGAAVVLERYARGNGFQSDPSLLVRALGWVTGQPVSLPGAGVELGF